jgi:pyruvate formate lyase activating enzyme
MPREQDVIMGRPASPEQIAHAAHRAGCASVAYTYTEPTIFAEYALDTAREAQTLGLKNVFVSNGYMTPELLHEMAGLIDGINVDLKAFTPEFYREQCHARLEPVKRNIAYIAQETDIWIEITTLLIPGLNDSDEELRAMAEWLASVDVDMPWHVTAFHPDYEMLDRPRTSPRSLSRAYEIGKKAGLRYVYVGNVLDADRESTYCPECGQKLIQRHWYYVEELWRERGICPRCGAAIAGVWA